ncbi:hypothetical protein Salat_1139900 [Sesamum alatum]|uniref:Uncharacterized protein n=1 Tax=Sesamum alatum TaxID=300844 RepID=A0AAE2CN80_9LAMI|nr:hypothetical protein Salat_1139900 [Sesamum alatum]
MLVRQAVVPTCPKAVGMVLQLGRQVGLASWSVMIGRVGRVSVCWVGHCLSLSVWCMTMACTSRFAAHVVQIWCGQLLALAKELWTWLDAVRAGSIRRADGRMLLTQPRLVHDSLADGWQARAQGNDKCTRARLLLEAVVPDGYQEQLWNGSRFLTGS